MEDDSQSTVGSSPAPAGEAGLDRPRQVLAWSSLLFAVLQSICTFFVAVSGLRLVIGAGSLVLAAGLVKTLGRFHAGPLRLPMILFALCGSLLNIAVLARIRRLRSRPASRWRQSAPAPGKLRMERLEFALSSAALLIVAVEEGLHLWIHHRI